MDLVDRIAVTAESKGDGFVDFSVTISHCDAEQADEELVLRVGSTNAMRLNIPANPTKAVRQFGPSRVPITALRRNTDFAVALQTADGTLSMPVPQERLSGDLFEAAAISSTEDFLHRIQNNHSKFSSADVLTIGAKSFYHRTESLELQAASLTILFHRLIWTPAKLKEADIAFCAWLVAEARVVLRACRKKMKAEPPTWELVRWMASLATVAGHGALIGNNPGRAKELYIVAAGQMNNLKLSPVSGLNIINGCFFGGLLAAATDDMETAARLLRSAVNGLRNMVNAQNLLANIWVTGDVLDAGRTSRQAMIALVRLKLVKGAIEPMISLGHQLDIAAVQSPVAQLRNAGFSKDIWNKLESMLDRDIVQ